MTHLNIQQGQNIEVVTTQIIKKLYEAALSVPEPLEGEQDAAYMSGNLQVNKSYRALVEYLTNRFDDLHINVTDSYYIPFEDSAVLNVLLANNIGSDGIGVTEAEATNATLTNSMFQGNMDITSFNTFKYFTKANNNPPAELFRSCNNLASVDMSNITALSASEFRATSLTSINIPEGVSRIPNQCFYWCQSNTSVTLPQSCTSIGNQSFYNNIELLSVTAPNIQIIGQSAFDCCSSLTSFSDFSKVTEIGPSAFAYSKVSGILDCPNLTSLGASAFNSGHRFQGIECLGTIQSVGGFGHTAGNANSSLQYVYLPYECTQLSENAFVLNRGLSTLKQYDKTISAYQEGETKTFLPNLSKITSFGRRCFQECFALSLTGADIVNATYIGNYAFQQTSLSGAISLPHLISLEDGAFKGCTNITSVDLTGSTITSIPTYCFRGCSSLTSVILPNTCFTLVGQCFSLCTSLATIYMSNIKNISGYEVFANTAITRLDLPAIETISQRGLSGCHNCGIVDLGPNLSYIGNQAFWDGAYTTFIFRGTTVPTFDMTNSSGKFLFNMNNVAIYVPESALSDYQTAWPQMASNMVKIEGSVYDTQS